MNPRTPIEAMADRACKFDHAGRYIVPEPIRLEPGPEYALYDLHSPRRAAIALEVVNAAVAWSRNENDSEARLRAAVKAWVAAGG